MEEADDFPWAPVDPIAAALHPLRMSGVFYCRTAVTAPWALEMPAFADCVSFHVVTTGGCWLEVAGADPLYLRAGDLALVPHGRGHLLYSQPGVATVGRVDRLPQQMLGEHYSILRHGGGGAASTLVCGVISFHDPAAQQLVGLLPPVIHIDGSAGPARTWIGDTLGLMVAELGHLRPGGEAVTTRLADILVIQAIRTWLETDPAARTGWLGALHDAQIGRAIAAVHRDPGRPWSLAALAKQAAMSRSAFAARFTHLVGEPPMRYVTRWRMQVAAVRLRQGRATVGELATRFGYDSEAAFSRAFKRVVGVSPGAVRALAGHRGRPPSASDPAVRPPDDGPVGTAHRPAPALAWNRPGRTAPAGRGREGR